MRKREQTSTNKGNRLLTVMETYSLRARWSALQALPMYVGGWLSRVASTNLVFLR
jgi:hypothetical protein